MTIDDSIIIETVNIHFESLQHRTELMDEDLASHGCRHSGFGWGGDVGVPGARADASLGEKKSVWYLDMLGKYGTITKIPWFSSINY